MARWSICAMVKERRPVLERFVSHHLALGADYIHLFFDDGDDPEYDHFAGRPGVRAVRCDAAFWDKLGRRRAPFQERRQIIKARLAYAACRTDWQIHLDADELLCPAPGRTVADTLDCIAPDEVAARVEVVEPMQLPPGHAADGPHPFRRPLRGMRRWAKMRILGPYLPLTQNGHLGHSQGKTFLRAGLADWTHGIHWPRALAGQPRRWAELDGCSLAHLHCADRAEWLARIEAKRAARGYGYNMRVDAWDPVRDLRAALGAAAEGRDDHALLGDFFDAVTLYDGTLRQELDQRGLIERHDLALSA